VRLEAALGWQSPGTCRLENWVFFADSTSASRTPGNTDPLSVFSAAPRARCAGTLTRSRGEIRGFQRAAAQAGVSSPIRPVSQERPEKQILSPRSPRLRVPDAPTDATDRSTANTSCSG
jgi:hypothetical protein